MASKCPDRTSKCPDRCGDCCSKWKYPRKYHNKPWTYINELQEEGTQDQKGVKFVPHPKYKSYLSCAYLKKNEAGLSLCSIYDKRPDYCATFVCL